jgi:hypothetical protein
MEQLSPFLLNRMPATSASAGMILCARRLGWMTGATLVASSRRACTDCSRKANKSSSMHLIGALVVIAILSVGVFALAYWLNGYLTARQRRR